MSALAGEALATAPAVRGRAVPARVALLGTGTVGRAVLRRLAGWQGTALGARLSLALVANTREAYAAVAARGTPRPARAGDGWHGLLPRTLAPLADGIALDAVAEVLGPHGPRIVVDATASDAVAARHAQWLAQGIHVVTANKLGQGAALARWRAIRDARAASGAQYGDGATVGAGLPLLRTIRALRAGGDRIHAIEGVLSGSLAWLFDRYDGMRPFSGFVREARAAGYTEPDPRDDLSGEDVRRKLLILARAAGHALEADAVAVESLVPPRLAALPAAEVDAALPLLDAPLRERYAAAYRNGERLRFIARFDGRSARVGLCALPPEHPLCAGGGTDNRVAIASCRYAARPLLIQGPGAGAEVTAAALLDDVLACVDGPAYEVAGFGAGSAAR
ncbi:homoserine dehydrogenase [Vulcaniibacterium gelatinicum]|uniref:homoserine dehydrogenase n=1 Tax=Vulcaniibacterium gelatinicum TaxID=2598725 RepID=UPI0011C75175|nr:homoserine dehydrogenase [Vulcaniibacterium gelatinicum]